MNIQMEKPNIVIKISLDQDTLETLAGALDCVCYGGETLKNLTKKEQEVLMELLNFLADSTDF